MSLKYAYNPKIEKSSKAYGRALSISTISSTAICKAITGKNIAKGKDLLIGLLAETRSIGGKYYTNSAKEILDLLKSAESNAEFKGLESSRLQIHASAHQGFTFMRPRRFQVRGQRRRVTNLQIILEEK